MEMAAVSGQLSRSLARLLWTINRRRSQTREARCNPSSPATPQNPITATTTYALTCLDLTGATQTKPATRQGVQTWYFPR